jgi:hypothetical protein
MADVARLCLRCRAEIPAERIEALPDTLVCVQCSREIGGEYNVRVLQENLGKGGSLKKNYGGVRIHKVRKRILPKEAEMAPADSGE